MAKSKGLTLAALAAIAVGALVYWLAGPAAGSPPPGVRDAARYGWETLRDFPWRDRYGFEHAGSGKHGLRAAQIQKLSDDLARKGTKAFLVLQNNEIVHEWYGGFHGAHVRYHTASLAKALAGSMVLLFAIDRGQIRLDDPAWRYIPEWRDDSLRSQITVGDLANHTSGIEHPDESENLQSDAGNWKAEYWRNHSKRFHIALQVAPVIFPPGTRVSYSNPAYAALSYALASRLRRAPDSDLEALLRTEIMQPLGVPDHHWTISYDRRFHYDSLTLRLLEGGGRYTARAAARVGQLVAEGGTWEGQRLFSSRLVDTVIAGESARAARRPEWKPVPALGWWSNAERTWPHLPKDTLIGAGAGHQVVIVVPSRGMVVVRQGRSLGGTGWGRDHWQALDHRLLRPLAEILDPAANYRS